MVVRFVISSEARTEKSYARAAAQVEATSEMKRTTDFRWRGAARFLGSCLTRNDKAHHHPKSEIRNPKYPTHVFPRFRY